METLRIECIKADGGTQVQEGVRREAAARRAGRRQWSINGAFEVLRWQQSLSTQGDDFRLNNSYRSFYARKIMDAVPELAGFFEVRELQSA